MQIWFIRSLAIREHTLTSSEEYVLVHTSRKTLRFSVRKISGLMLFNEIFQVYTDCENNKIYINKKTFAEC
jgi:hypothetical protein